MSTTRDLPRARGLDDEGAVAEAARRLARTALAEDLLPGGDPTSAAIPAGHEATGVIAARSGGVVSGLEVVPAVLAAAAEEPVAGLLPGAGRLSWSPAAANGDELAAGAAVGTLSGPTAALLSVERTVLNALTHLSGVASYTHSWVARAADAASQAGVARPAIRDSRKTLPGLRLLEKRAVAHGGGSPHRFNLSDQAMVKDNHVAGAGGVVEALIRVRAAHPGLWCEVEVDSLGQLEEILGHEPDQVLLDNFSLDEVARAVALRDEKAPRVPLEASGGIALETLAGFAATGVDSIAAGALTHSAPALDLGLDLG